MYTIHSCASLLQDKTCSSGSPFAYTVSSINFSFVSFQFRENGKMLKNDLRPTSLIIMSSPIIYSCVAHKNRSVFLVTYWKVFSRHSANVSSNFLNGFFILCSISLHYITIEMNTIGCTGWLGLPYPNTQTEWLEKQKFISYSSEG